LANCIKDTLAKAREDIIQERLDVDKEYEILDMKALDTERKILRMRKETSDMKEQLEEKIKQLQAENEVLPNSSPLSSPSNLVV
jgi:hypothetical protein